MGFQRYYAHSSPSAVGGISVVEKVLGTCLRATQHYYTQARVFKSRAAGTLPACKIWARKKSLRRHYTTWPVSIRLIELIWRLSTRCGLGNNVQLLHKGIVQAHVVQGGALVSICDDVAPFRTSVPFWGQPTWSLKG